ncbi:MAG: MATE family efflux transporter [Bacteroidales bacterium]|nr:MATE family efflux transporter [Bacteroidales bacterium]
MAQIDMLHGPLGRKIILFALPLAASSVLQQMFNAIDVAVVGRFASSEALAAVGSNSPVINLLVNLFVGISMGANVVIANHLGQKNNEGVRRSVATSAVVALASGIFLMLLGLTVTKPILELMGTPDDVIDLASLYLRIYFLGMPFILVFNFGSAILRSMGDTRRPLICLGVSGVVNTVLNLILVIGFDRGVDGVAIATVAANVVNAVMVVRMLAREQGPVRLDVQSLKVSWPEMRKMLKIGVPAGVQGMVFSFSNVVIQSAINSFGSAAMGGSAAALTYEQFCYFFMSAFCGAAVTFIGQNYGAGDKERCRKVFRLCMLMSVAAALFLNCGIVLARVFFVSLFTTDPAVASFAYDRLLIALAFQWLACSYEISGAALRGMGHSALPAVMVIFGTCLLRLAWVYFALPLCPTFPFLVAVYPVSWAVTGVLVFGAYLRISRSELK